MSVGGEGLFLVFEVVEVLVCYVQYVWFEVGQQWLIKCLFVVVVFVQVCVQDGVVGVFGQYDVVCLWVVCWFLVVVGLVECFFDLWIVGQFECVVIECDELKVFVEG